jgi:hypothetical protein
MTIAIWSLICALLLYLALSAGCMLALRALDRLTYG